MREVEGLALGDEGGELGPGLRLGGVGKEVHDDGTSADGLLDGEEGLSRNPSVLLRLLPAAKNRCGTTNQSLENRQMSVERRNVRLSTLSDTDDDLDTLVSSVETLTVTLRTVTDHGKGVILEVPGSAREPK